MSSESEKGFRDTLFFKFAEVFNDAGAAARLARNAGITPVQDQPVVTINLKFSGNHFE